MKIATYNVWNESKDNHHRDHQLIDVINAVNADVIGLQEVTSDFFHQLSKKATEYPYHEFRKYQNEDEGLATLSKYPLKCCYFLNEQAEYACSFACNVLFQVDGSSFSLTNVHLPWDSVKAKEEQIVAIDRFLHLQRKEVDYFILLGDFNGSLNSSVHRYLLGEQTLSGQEAKPYWHELSSSYAELNRLPLKPTLDFVNNPRWAGKNTIEIPTVTDRIYLLNDFSEKMLRSVEIFGTEVSPVTQLAASDHFGVVAEVDFPEMQKKGSE